MPELKTINLCLFANHVIDLCVFLFNGAFTYLFGTTLHMCPGTVQKKKNMTLLFKIAVHTPKVQFCMRVMRQFFPI